MYAYCCVVAMYFVGEDGNNIIAIGQVIQEEVQQQAGQQQRSHQGTGSFDESLSRVCKLHLPHAMLEIFSPYNNFNC